MKVLFSLTYYAPYVSGLTLYVKRLAEELTKKEYQCTAVSFLHDAKLPKEDTINGVRVVRIKPQLKISKGFLSTQWISRCIQEVRQAEVVVVNLPQFEAIIPALFAKIFRKKLVAIYHCQVQLPTGFLSRLIETVLGVSHWITLTFSESVVTYTKDYADHSKLLSHFDNKIRFVYPPIVIPKINKRVQELFIKRIGKSDCVIGIAARLASEKGIEFLLDAIPLLESRIKNQVLRIVIAGPIVPVGEEKYKKKIMKLVEKYKKYVVILGSLKEEEMGSFYSLIDILVLPSVNSTESFGMVQVEAMMMGVPVVASDLPGVRVPIQKTRMGRVVAIRNNIKLAEAIAEVLQHRDRYVKSGTIIKNEFSLDKTVRFYENMFAR